MLDRPPGEEPAMERRVHGAKVMRSGLSFSARSDARDRSFLAYPRFRQGKECPAGWQAVARGGAVDAVILTRHATDQALSFLLNNLEDPLLPVVSIVSQSHRLIDAAPAGEDGAWARAEQISKRLNQLTDAVRYSSRPEDILLARMYSRELALAPVYDRTSRELVSYPLAGRMENVPETANRLCEDGLLARTFFDKLQCCPDCRSSVLNVREECNKCRSSNIEEQTIVHHFRCGHMAPESTFRNGVRFECPKCGDALRHIGLDYDKPGSVVICADCGDINDLPAIGFKCIDCGSHHDSEQVPVVTRYSYALTGAGIAYLTQGVPGMSERFGLRHERFDMLLEQVQREQREFKTPFQVMRMRFINAGAIRDKSVRLWEETRKLVDDALHSSLREVDAVRDEGDSMLILMPRADRREAEAMQGAIRRRLGDILKEDLQVGFEVLPEPRLWNRTS